MKRLIILNPASRNGAAGSAFEQARAKWESLLGAFTLYETKEAGDATRKVAEVLSENSYDQILIAGGDGSINEAARGYWRDGEIVPTDIPLGVINLGTGGDFYKTIQASSSDYEAALVANESDRVDCGNVEDGKGMQRAFLNIASVGLAGDMLRRLKASRFQNGAVAYFYHTLFSLLAYTPREVTVSWVDPDGESHEETVTLLNGFVCNGRYSGGGMQWAPAAELNDGLLRVSLITGERKWPLVLQSGKLYSGRIDEFPGAKTFAAKSVEFACKQGLSLETDGELIDSGEDGASRYSFSVREKVFPIVL